MANKYLIILVTLAIAQRTHQSLDDNEVESEDVNPWAEAASTILKEQNMQNIGSMVNGFLQAGGAKQISDILGNLGQKNGADIGNVLSKIDPSVLASAVNLFAANNDYEKPVAPGDSKKTRGGAGFNVADMVFAASQLMNQQDGEGGNPLEGVMHLLPTLLSSVGSFMGPEATERAKSHEEHASQMPPLLEKVHVYFDHLLHSDIGKYVINLLGAEKIFKIFTDDSGRFDYQKFGEMLENHSFRRHWIRMVTDRFIELLKSLSDPAFQKQYSLTIPLVANSFLKTQGFPKTAQLDFNKPTESVSTIINYASKKYLGTKVDSKEYIKPLIEKLQLLLQVSQKQGFLSDTRKISDTLADTINLELIEPIARVNRAYRFAKNVPECDRYVFCLVNEDNQNDVVALPELKKMLYKGSSLVASWFVSGNSNSPFWTLYEVITSNSRCKDYYLKKCNDFHIEEVKVTTEYVHSEL